MPLAAETPAFVPWCVLPFVALVFLVGGAVMLRLLLMPAGARFIELAWMQAKIGQWRNAESILLMGLQSSPAGGEDQRRLAAALDLLRRDPKEFLRDPHQEPNRGRVPRVAARPPAPFGLAQPVIDEALALDTRGDKAGALRVLDAALTAMPPAHAGEAAAARFWVQTFLAHYVRVVTGDRERECRLLRDCIPLVAFIPPDPPGPDAFTNFRYLFGMNRGVAANAIGRFDEAAAAMREALAVARQAETRCKCLAFLGDNLLRLSDVAAREEARSAFDRFDADAASAAAPALLRLFVAQGRAVLCLHAGEVPGARTYLQAALDLEPITHLRLALEALRAPNPDVDKTIQMILFPKRIDPTEAMRQVANAAKPLPPLSPDVGPAPPPVAAPLVAMTEIECDRLMDRVVHLDQHGQFSEAEALLRQGLTRARAGQRVELLPNLAHKLTRQGRYDEALELSAHAVHAAHDSGDVPALAYAFDVRAALQNQFGDYTGALRSLQEARAYLQFSGLQDIRPLNARLNQTWGNAYHGCGMWDQAAKALRQALEYYVFQREWIEWRPVAGDLVKVGIARAQAEGPDADALRELRELLQKALPMLADHPTFAITAALDDLWLRQQLALLERDWPELARVRQGYAELMQTHGRPGGALLQAEHFSNHVEWTVSTSRIERALAEAGRHPPDIAAELLAGQVRILTAALNRVPQTFELWHERAALLLCQARLSQQTPQASIAGAAECLETALDLLTQEAAHYGTAEARAGWVGRFTSLTQLLGEAIAFALNDVSPPESATAARLLALAQTLKARTRHDLVRSLESLRPATAADRAAAADLLARVRALHRWLERLAIEGRHDANSPSRGMAVIGRPRGETPAVHLDRVATECVALYPEYGDLTTREQVEAELSRCKGRLQRLATHNVAVRPQAAQALDEAPFDLDAWRSRLADDEAAIDYFVGPGAAYAVLLTRSTLAAFRLPVNGLRPLLHLVQTKLSPGDHLDADLRRCSGWLLPDELTTSLVRAEVRRVSFVAAGPLWGVPFAWLTADETRALERWEVVTVPSLRLAGGAVASLDSRRAIAVGHPGEPPLPGAAREARDVAALLDGVALMHADATPARVLAEALTADVVHVACHAQADAVVPWLSFLQLAPDAAHADGRLMLFEVLAAPVRALVVNAAACYSARVEGPTSFPESLAHAFLGAGARHVVASLWEADDAECLAFAADFYAELKAHRNVPRAFRAAQLKQVERGGAASRCANFVLLGAAVATEADERKR